MKAALALAAGALVLFVTVLIVTALGYRSDCVRMEASVKAQYGQNQNNYDNMWKKFREMAQVPAQYSADMQKIWDGAMTGRYGADGSKAMFQFIKEQNPQLDPSMYVKIQTAIEAGRNSFAADQRQLLDIKREYELILNGNRALLVGWLFGYPKIDLAKYDIVTSSQTEKAFEDKKADEVDIFKR